MNERIRRMRDEFEGGAARIHAVMCECIDPACSTMLQLSGPELVSARVDDGHFIVDATHAEGVEVVQRHGSFAVVRFT